VNQSGKLRFGREQASALLFVACWAAYAVICLSKNAYSASIASIVQEGIFSKSKAGLINSAYWAVYGLAQLLGVKIIDRISPVHFITLALCGSALANIGMAMSDSFGSMLFFWSLCGILQFATWPATVRILTEFLIDEHKSRAMILIAFAQCVGILINYFSAAVVLKLAGWKMIFIVSSAMVLLVMLFWLFSVKKSIKLLTAERKIKRIDTVAEMANKYDGIDMGKLIITSGLLFLIVPSFIRSALDNGITSWVPTMISESYAVSTSFSNVLTMVLVFINLSGVFICALLYPKRIKNVVLAFGMCFAAVIPMTIVLLLIGKIPLGVVVALLTGITTMMYAGYQMNYVIIPAEFSCCGKSGSVASVLNAFASFGIVAASFGFGFLAEHTGWSGTIIAWIVMAVAAVVSCLIAVPIWERFVKNNNLKSS